ncbi:MAG: head GIN domain-containing protein [Pseudomonadota bacterium]
MIRTLALSAAAAGAVSLAAFSDSYTLDLSGFDGVDVSAGQTVVFTQGAAYSVAVEMKRGDLDDMRIEVDDGDLVVRPRRTSWVRRGPRAIVTVTAPGLERIEASSGSSFEGEGLQSASLSIDSSSGASVSVDGTCGTLEVDISSGSSVSARDLQCANVIADASSGASVSAYATDSVSADASSGSSVTVYGGAPDVTQDRSSGASISIKS